MSEANKFLVRYASGVETVMHSMCESVEAFCNEHFGSTWGDAQANGASVTMNANAVEAKVVEAPVAEPEAPAAAPESVLDEFRHEAADLLHKAERALGLDDSDTLE